MIFHIRFQHITQQISEYFNRKNLQNVRKVSKSWQEFIDDRIIPWNEIFKNKDCNKVFQLSCQNGLKNIAVILVKKSLNLKVNLNAKDKNGKTGLHLACINGHSKIIEMLIENSVEQNIDLNSKDEDGRTTFHLGTIQILRNQDFGFFLTHSPTHPVINPY